MSSTELDAIEINPKNGEAQASVIWLHGLGADGHDFEPIVPELNLSDEHKVRFIFPHAPQRPVTVNGGYVMRAWYDILEMSIDRRVDHAGIAESVQWVTQLIKREIERGIDASSIVVAGFSQGGVIALEAGLKFRPKLAGIIALSTYLADHEQVPTGDMPIFMGHGSADPVVPLELGEQARDTLKNKGHNVEWHRYPMQHSVAAAEITAIGLWLKAHLFATD